VAKVNQKQGNTKQLEVVWEAINDDNSHPTADQIYNKVRQRFPNLSLGTVYRKLQKLVADEKLQALMLGRAQHFDPLVKRHQHLICEKCRQVYDVLVDTENEIKPARLPQRGFKSHPIKPLFTAPANIARVDRYRLGHFRLGLISHSSLRRSSSCATRFHEK
jgi:Fur family transcriptional regulator, peroxide stress response regulator